MDFEDSIREAAKRADSATKRAIRMYRLGHVTDEDDITGVLVGSLEAELAGNIGNLKWAASILRHRRGVASEEKETGADMIIHVRLETKNLRYSKGVLVQAKRVEPGRPMTNAEFRVLGDQCKKMLDITPASFVFDYTTKSVRCGSASRILGARNSILHDQCSWTSYRFFLELFRCPIGDTRLTSASAKDLPVPITVTLKASEIEAKHIL